MKIFTIFLTIWMNSVQATTVLIQAHNSERLSYRAQLQANPEYISVTQRILELRPTTRERDLLIQQFAKAQSAYLDKTLENATAEFEKVAELTSLTDWNREDRDILTLAYLRLAQLSRTEKKRDQWLSNSLLISPSGAVTKALAAQIPPPILLRRKELLAQLGTMHVRHAQTPNWDLILINGHPCDGTECGKWITSSQKVRVTFISDRWLPQTIHTELSEISNLKPKPIPWVTGSCNAIDENRAIPIFSENKVFWSTDCKQGSAQNINLSTTNSKPNFEVPRLNLDPELPSFMKSKWFWAGVGVASALIIMDAQQRSHKGTNTTTTYGFR